MVHDHDNSNGKYAPSKSPQTSYTLLLVQYVRVIEIIVAFVILSFIKFHIIRLTAERNSIDVNVGVCFSQFMDLN